MGRKLILLLACLAFIFQGCEAFHNYYDDPGIELSELQPAETTEEGGGEKVIDYSADSTPCENVSGVLTSIVSGGDEIANDGWTIELKDGETVSVLAEKKGLYTTKMTIAKGAKKLSFTVKRVANDKINVCDVIYEDCIGECLGVKSLWSDVEEGSITVYKFNQSESDSVVNSGTYDITFAESNMGDVGMTLEGGYFTDLVGEAFEVE